MTLDLRSAYRTMTLARRLDEEMWRLARAGRAHFAQLLEAGVSIHLYRPGLLHAKTTTVDDAFAIVGSANLDLRSFNLNFELKRSEAKDAKDAGKAPAKPEAKKG